MSQNEEESKPNDLTNLSKKLPLSRDEENSLCNEKLGQDNTDRKEKTHTPKPSFSNPKKHSDEPN